MRVTAPSSASKMIATLSGCVARCRSRQLYDALSSPSWNHLKNGAFDSSSVFVNGFFQSSSARACFAQNPSKSRSASAHIARYASMPEMLAWATNSGAGGNTRLSVNTDSIMDDISGSPPEGFAGAWSDWPVYLMRRRRRNARTGLVDAD